jgi:hypothetical protein
MLSFYLAFLYGNDKYIKYDKDRILCMAEYLFRIQAKFKYKQKGILKRFGINCYGKQTTREEMRAEKNLIYEKMKSKAGTSEYDEYFLNYNPGEKKNDKQIEKKNDKHVDENVEEFKKNMPKTKKHKKKTKKTKKNNRFFFD